MFKVSVFCFLEIYCSDLFLNRSGKMNNVLFPDVKSGQVKIGRYEYINKTGVLTKVRNKCSGELVLCHTRVPSTSSGWLTDPN